MTVYRYAAPIWGDPYGDQMANLMLAQGGVNLTIKKIDVMTFDLFKPNPKLDTALKNIFLPQAGLWQAWNPKMKDWLKFMPKAQWLVWRGLKPGARDTAAATALSVLGQYLGTALDEYNEAFSSEIFLVKTADNSSLTTEELKAALLKSLINHVVNDLEIIDLPAKGEFTPRLPKVTLKRKIAANAVKAKDAKTLLAYSDDLGLALRAGDTEAIMKYYQSPQAQKKRVELGLPAGPTDVEMEYFGQSRSDHCNHNTFGGNFTYYDEETGHEEKIESLFKTYISNPTKEIAKNKSWVLSVLWDNAGVGHLTDDLCYAVTAETHNSPSNLEAFGGAQTGLVGAYRDIMGTGLGAQTSMAAWALGVGPRDYSGRPQPPLHPRRLMDTALSGVTDGGAKLGAPTITGRVNFDEGYVGKCMVFVATLGLMPKDIAGKPSYEKSIAPGDLVVICGSRTGCDGLHGVSASSLQSDESTPLGHAQLGDPYSQSRTAAFLLAARDLGLIKYITDNGGGGFSSAVGETAQMCGKNGGATVNLEKVPTKYPGMLPWEIWVSESQERMTMAVAPQNLAKLTELAALFEVEMSAIGEYNDSGYLHLAYQGRPCALIDYKFTESAFPRWNIEARWQAPEKRGLLDPQITEPSKYGDILKDLLGQPNLALDNHIGRANDHEVGGGSVVKAFLSPLDTLAGLAPSDAAVTAPAPGQKAALAIGQALSPRLGLVDAGLMTAFVIDEAIRRVVAVGGDPDHLAGLDNYCWPAIEYHPQDNPDGRLKAAQLVRSAKTLAEACRAYDMPLLSGKDSMYMDGWLPNEYGQREKVSAPPTLVFTVVSRLEKDKAQTPQFKAAGDLIYILGETKAEMAGSEYYRMLGYLGLNIPKTDFKESLANIKLVADLIKQGLAVSVRGLYQGGLGLALVNSALGGGLGAEIDIKALTKTGLTPSAALFSETPGRFLISVRPENKAKVEKLLKGRPLCLAGKTAKQPTLTVKNGDQLILSETLTALKTAWAARS